MYPDAPLNDKNLITVSLRIYRASVTIYSKWQCGRSIPVNDWLQIQTAIKEYDRGVLPYTANRKIMESIRQNRPLFTSHNLWLSASDLFSDWQRGIEPTVCKWKTLSAAISDFELNLPVETKAQFNAPAAQL